MAFDLYKYLPESGCHCFAVWPGAFSTEEVDKIAFLEKLQNFEQGKVGGRNQEPHPDVRNSEISWIFPDQNSHWIFERFGQLIPRVNHDHFMFNIKGLENLQYTKYGIDQHYNWHWDLSFGWENYQRKMSVILMLSEPDEYEGGELEICNNGNFDDTWVAKPNRGDMIFFASWMPHRVRPVTSGIRKTLVGWVMGPREN